MFKNPDALELRDTSVILPPVNELVVLTKPQL